MRAEADEVLARMRLDDVADHPAAGLPYGTLKRVELARAVSCSPACCCSTSRPAAQPRRGRRARRPDPGAPRDLDLTVPLVEHNMGMVMDLCDQVVVLDVGRKIAEGDPAPCARTRA